MPPKVDEAERVQVVGVKPDGKKFKATMRDGQEREFTLSTQSPIVCPAMNDDIIVHYNVQTPTDPEKIARFGKAPTYWANKIEPARSDEGYGTATPQGTYAQAQAQFTKPPEENGAQKKDVYQAEGDARNSSIEMQVCLKAAVEIVNKWEGGAGSPQVVEVAQGLYNGLFTPGPHPLPDAEQEGEPEPQYTG